MAKTKRRIGAFMQTFGEGLSGALEKKREWEMMEPYRAALAEQARATAANLEDERTTREEVRGYIRNIMEELGGGDRTLAALQDPTIASALLAGEPETVTMPPRPGEPGDTFTRQLLAPVTAPPPPSKGLRYKGQEILGPYPEEPDVSLSIKGTPRKYSREDQLRGAVGQMANVSGVSFDPSAIYGQLEPTPEWDLYQKGQEGIQSALITEGISPTIREMDVLSPSGLAGTFTVTEPDLRGGIPGLSQASEQVQDLFRPVPTTPEQSRRGNILSPEEPGWIGQRESGDSAPWDSDEYSPFGINRMEIGGIPGTFAREFSPQERNLLRDLAPVYSTLDDMEKLVDVLNTQTGWTQLTTGAWNWIRGQTNIDPDAALMMRLRSSYAGQFAQLGGEGASRLSDQDVQRAMNALPSLFMSPELAHRMIRFARGLLDRKKYALLYGDPDIGQFSEQFIEDYNNTPTDSRDENERDSDVLRILGLETDNGGGVFIPD